MALISDDPIEVLYCVKSKFTNYKHDIYCYFKSEPFAQEKAHRDLLNEHVSNVEIHKCRVIDDNEIAIREIKHEKP